MADGLLVATDTSIKQNPNLDLSQQVFAYDYACSHNDLAKATALKDAILEAIRSDNMLPYYSALCAKYNWIVDEELSAAMRLVNETALRGIEAKHDDALENAGDMEVMDALFAKARHYASIGDIDSAYAAYDVILTKDKTSTGKKIDANMEKCRVAFFAGDIIRQKGLLAETSRLIDFGGDWDRRNRLKVYEAFYLMACRELKKASELLLDCVATFTCVELCSYTQFMHYAVITGIMSLPRSKLKKEVVKNPQVIAVLRDVPSLQKFLRSIYECEYRDFFSSMVDVLPFIYSDKYLSQHSAFITREYRVLAYAQFLEAYKSVTLSAMAQSFGISIDLLDRELSRFVAAKRLNAKIDKVGDVVQTLRPDKKNIQYQEIVKKGDALLNQIQKLARVIEL